MREEDAGIMGRVRMVCSFETLSGYGGQGERGLNVGVGLYLRAPSVRHF